MNVLEVTRWSSDLEAWTARWHEDESFAPPAADEFSRLLVGLHRSNFLLWHEEDVARRTDVDPAEIARVKRAVDRLNQQRNDSIELIDEWLLVTRYAHLADRDLPLRTETPGQATDRLSVLALKVFHMREQTLRADVSAEHVQACTRKLVTLVAQRTDLSRALADMLAELERGAIRMKIYRQFKMYNDPSLNPQLYAGRR